MKATSREPTCPECGHAASRHRGRRWPCQVVVTSPTRYPLTEDDWCKCEHSPKAVAEMSGTWRGVPSQSVRRAVIARDGFRCSVCGCDVHSSDRVSGNTLTLDHLVPVSAGGKSTLDNLRVCCFSCNARKGSS